MTAQIRLTPLDSELGLVSTVQYNRPIRFAACFCDPKAGADVNPAVVLLACAVEAVDASAWAELFSDMVWTDSVWSCLYTISNGPGLSLISHKGELIATANGLR